MAQRPRGTTVVRPVVPPGAFVLALDAADALVVEGHLRAAASDCRAGAEPRPDDSPAMLNARATVGWLGEVYDRVASDIRLWYDASKRGGS